MRNHGMYKPKVEFYHHYIYSGLSPTYLEMYMACLVQIGYVLATYEVNRTKKNRVIDPLILSNFISLWPWPLPYGPETV